MQRELLSGSTLMAAVQAHAVSKPDAVAFTYLPDGLPEDAQSVTYAVLNGRARKLGSRLRALGHTGDRVQMLFPPGVDFVVAYVGTLYAGMIAVPAPLPGTGQGAEWRRSASIATDCDPIAVLTLTEHVAEVDSQLSAGTGKDIRVIGVDDAELQEMPAWPEADEDAGGGVGPDDVAVLQYTSGSTGAPKGVMVTHGNLRSNVSEMVAGVGLGSDDVLGGWLPMFHDMGLFATLTPALWLGVPCVTMSPVAFVKRPRRWLEMIDHFGITYSAAPNFAYEMCVRRIPNDSINGMDLSRWAHAVNGSEPVRSRTLEAFAEHFRAAGFRRSALAPSYGLAESTVYVSTSHGLRTVRVDADEVEQHRFVLANGSQRAQEFVSCGRVDHLEWRIVEPGQSVDRGSESIGELWLRGPSVSPGYWANPEASRKAFGLRIEGETEGSWMRTGDLAVVSDGELFVTGRLKETMIFNGRNLYPQDIEDELRRHHPQLGDRGAVFAVSSAADQPDALVITHEIQKTKEIEPSVLMSEMRHTVRREFGLVPGAVALLAPNSVLRTTSGKIRRGEMQERFRRGALSVLHLEGEAGSDQNATVRVGS